MQESVITFLQRTHFIKGLESYKNTQIWLQTYCDFWPRLSRIWVAQANGTLWSIQNNGTKCACKILMKLTPDCQNLSLKIANNDPLWIRLDSYQMFQGFKRVELDLTVSFYSSDNFCFCPSCLKNCFKSDQTWT